MQKGIQTTWLLIALGAITATPAHGNAYKILGVKDAEATAMGEAFVVQADNPSAVAFNPAGLAQLRGNRVSVHAMVCDPYSERTMGGATTRMERRMQAVPSFFACTDVGSDRLAVGIGLFLPNGLSTDWADDSFARYVATYSSLTVMDLSVGCGVRATEKLSLGAGLDLLYSEACLDRMIDAGLMYGAPGLMDMPTRLSGYGTTFSFRLGAIYEVNPRHAFALAYHHPFSISYDGTFTMAGAPSEVTASIDFPPVVVVGYAYRPADDWTIELNVDWTDWHSVDDITIDFVAPEMTDGEMTMGLVSTVACKIGAQYSWSERLTLRGGYIYNENATPAANWRPSLPDTDIHFITAGAGYAWNDLTVDVAVQLPLYDRRSIDNNVDLNEVVSSSTVDGIYRTVSPCLSLSATYVF